LGMLIALVVADGLISKLLVKHGFAREGNPFLQYWIGEDVFLVIKLLCAVLAGLVLRNMYKRNPKLSFISTVCFVIFYTLIVAWSLYIFFVTQM